MKPQRAIALAVSPRRKCNICYNTMEIFSRYHRLLIYDVKKLLKQTVWVPSKQIPSATLRYVQCHIMTMYTTCIVSNIIFLSRN